MLQNYLRPRDLFSYTRIVVKMCVTWYKCFNAAFPKHRRSMKPIDNTSCIIIRPLGTTVPDGLMFYLPVMFSFLSTPNLRAPSADRRDTLPHDRNLAEFYNTSPKIWGSPPKLGPKTCKMSVDLVQPQTLIANISGRTRDI